MSSGQLGDKERKINRGTDDLSPGLTGDRETYKEKWMEGWIMDGIIKKKV